MVSVACVPCRATRPLRWRAGQTVRVAFGAGAVGFILVRWLLSVCNIPAVCGWLLGISSLLAVVWVAAFVRYGTQLRPRALDRRVALLLVLTCALSLVCDALAAAPDRFWWHAGFVNGMDLLAWVWFVGGGLVVLAGCGGDFPPRRRVRLAFVICCSPRSLFWCSGFSCGPSSGPVRRCGPSLTTRSTVPLTERQYGLCTTASMA